MTSSTCDTYNIVSAGTRSLIISVRAANSADDDLFSSLLNKCRWGLPASLPVRTLACPNTWYVHKMGSTSCDAGIGVRGGHTIRSAWSNTAWLEENKCFTTHNLTNGFSISSWRDIPGKHFVNPTKNIHIPDVFRLLLVVSLNSRPCYSMLAERITKLVTGSAHK